ncbi:hypothetical protein [Cohnella caldifontis]|uniref:hypothetical protein n=1 Tax=Cohnella caldifontis TaxID=3027471 RepID=UPI0023EB76CD|nr:hypothetical protein [Cohnella sp. YIM B05605]
MATEAGQTAEAAILFLAANSLNAPPKPVESEQLRNFLSQRPRKTRRKRAVKKLSFSTPPQNPSAMSNLETFFLNPPQNPSTASS